MHATNRCPTVTGSRIVIFFNLTSSPSCHVCVGNACLLASLRRKFVPSIAKLRLTALDLGTEGLNELVHANPTVELVFRRRGLLLNEELVAQCPNLQDLVSVTEISPSAYRNAIRRCAKLGYLDVSGNGYADLSSRGLAELATVRPPNLVSCV